MIDTVVVDTSVALKWVLDEPDSGVALALLAEWSGANKTVFAPPLITYEAANALYQRVRKGQMSLDRAKAALAQALLVVEIMAPRSRQDLALSLRAMELAHQFSLPATYDPHYLALAEREGCEYWTADERLWNAVKGKLAWVRWLGDYQPPQAPASSPAGIPDAP